MKQTDYPSFDDIISLIPQEIEHNGKLSCLNQNSDSNFKGKRFYRLSTHNSKKDIHLTYGEDLTENYDKQTLFKDLLPQFVPKPLFINQGSNPEIFLMGQEFVDGIPIDQLSLKSPKKSQDLFLRIKENLDDHISKSTLGEWLEELNILKSEIFKISLLEDLDKKILENEILPAIENYISTQNPLKRWSNGDLAPRNVLGNLEDNVWLIDFEFSHQTHFFEEDMVRFWQYSSAKLKSSNFHDRLKDSFSDSIISYFWLRQAILDQKTKPESTKSDFLKVNLSNSLMALKKEKVHSPTLFGSLATIDRLDKNIIDLHKEKTDNGCHITTLKNHISSLEKDKVNRENHISSLEENKVNRENLVNSLRSHISSLEKKVEKNEHDLSFYLREVELHNDKIRRMQNSFSWVMTSWIRFLRRKFVDPLTKTKKDSICSANVTIIRTYSEWVRKYNTIKASEFEIWKKRLDRLKTTPKISVLMPVCDTEEEFLHKAIHSVIKQFYPNWELCIVDDASLNPNIKNILKSYAEQDSRIKLVLTKNRGHISIASNAALKIAQGTYAIFLDHDDELREHSLLRIVEEINKSPKVRFLYSDEDKIDEKGNRYDHHFKTNWNPDLLLSQNYICHLACCEIDLLRKSNGFREGFEGAQDWDLFLRITEQLNNDEISHIPEILYHWRASSKSTASSLSSKSYVHEAALKTLNDTIRRRSLRAAPKLVDKKNGYWRIAYQIPSDEPLVSILIPTKDRIDLLKTCIDSILKITKYKNFEILILDNESIEKNSHKYFEQVSELKNIKVIRVKSSFNYSYINNYGVKQANGNILAFVNNDIEITEPGWLYEMVSHAIRKEIGCVGAKLLYPNKTIQHAGVIIGIGGVAGHSFKNYPSTHSGYKHRLQLVQNYSAVTAACLVVEKEIFKKVGGFDEENLKVAFNDVDFCLKVLEAGFRNLWTPHSLMIHHESASRGLEKTTKQKKRFQNEVLFMQKKWSGMLMKDSFYNPNLSLDSEDFSLSFPPRS